LLKQLAITLGAVLAPTVRVMNQALGWSFRRYRPEQGSYYQVLGHSGSHLVADDFAGAQVLDCRQIKPAFIGGNVGDVGNPGGVRCSDVEVLLQEVRSYRQIVPRIGCRPEHPFLPTSQTELASQPLDPVEADCNAVNLGQLFLNFFRAIGAPATVVSRLDRWLEPFVFPFSGRGRPTFGGVIAATGYFQDLTHHGDRVPVQLPQFFHHRVPCCGPFARYAMVNSTGQRNTIYNLCDLKGGAYGTNGTARALRCSEG